jgi:aminoglycoside 6'-N-acetyltransferase I
MVEIRELHAHERDAWLGLRSLLWPDLSVEELRREQDEILANPVVNSVLVASPGGGEPVGFVEVSLRDWAEGCSTRPVGYIEAWYVTPEYRRSGVGRRLIDAAEAWALSHGCTEMGSDAELWNRISQEAHGALGYTEMLRLVLFSKKLNSAPGS